MGADGSQESRVLLDLPGWDAQPAWSPDGRTIAFTSDYFQAYDFTYDLGIMNADGSDVRPILKGPFFWGDHPAFYFQAAWSPDGQRIGVGICHDSWSLCGAEGREIAVAATDGSGLRVLTHAGANIRSGPTWSPDGRWIAFAALPCNTCPSSIRYVEVDGGAAGFILENGQSPAWRPEAGARINRGHAGAWFNPATSGQGQFLDVEPDRQFVFLGWFTYTEAASENTGQQHWFTAQGHYDGTKAELTLYESLGGRFDQAEALTTTPVGEVTLTFSGCGYGAMSYRFDDRDLAGSFPLMRAISGSQDECERRTEPTAQAVEVNHGMDGAWFDPTTSGQGFFFDVHANEDGGELMFVSWFTYGDDTASGQRWLTAEGPLEESRAELAIYDTRGGSFDDPRSAESVPVGTMSIDFADCRNALLSYSLDDGQLAGAMTISRLLPGGDALCEQISTLD